jgi:hypothetical protein
MNQVIVTYKMPEKEGIEKVYHDKVLDVIEVYRHDDFYVIIHASGKSYYNNSDIIKIDYIK